MKFALILLFKKIGNFDDPLIYILPDEIANDVFIGTIVEVPFRSKTHLGVVVDFPKKADTVILANKLKKILKVQNEFTLPRHSIDLAKFICHYYKSSLARSIKLMLPKRIWNGKIAPVETHKPCDVNPTFTKILTEDQQNALFQIETAKKPVLLQGVTGSGKTEIYLRLIHKVLEQNKQAILLLPEIALTPQVLGYFLEYFGEQIAVFHSQLTDKKRHENWWKVKRRECNLIIGSRSAIFAPVSDLGIIIIDEEHEWTYKQESAPYYQTHLIAEKLAEFTGAKLILGSATPSLETIYKSQNGDYELTILPKRINESPLPKMTLVDLREEFQKKNYSIFSELLKTKIKQKLALGEQIILFVNQRGLASAVVCRDCGTAITCPNCDISLKYHRGNPDQLMCHYCSFTTAPKISCDNCHSPHIKQIGVGTQRVEEELNKLFPEARVLRADSDTTKSKGFEPIYESFKQGDYDVLIGTQMIAKGLDFHQVSLIGIVLADIGLHIPDFRSSERLFQLVTQVAGRCGRGKSEGEVVLQTYNPDHTALTTAASYDYPKFIESELKHRKKFGYPPYSKIIKFTVVGSNPEAMEVSIKEEEKLLENIFENNDLPVKILSAPALLPKIKNQYYYTVLLRSDHPEDIFNYWRVPDGWRVDIDPIHTT